MDAPKRFETDLKPPDIVSETRRKAAISADPAFMWELVASPKRFETGLKLSETLGKQQYLLVLHLYGN